MSDNFSDLIPIGESNFNGDLIPTINARDLHEALGSKRNFTGWIKQQIERCMLLEDRDFVRLEGVYTKIGVNPSEGGRPRIEYYLTIDAAKQIAMVAGGEKGRAVREYFLACEKRLKAIVAGPPTPVLTLDMMIEAYQQKKLEVAALEEEKKALQVRTDQLQGRTIALALKASKLTDIARAFEKLAGSNGVLGVRETAYLLGILPGELTAILTKELGWAYKSNGDHGRLRVNGEYYKQGLVRYRGYPAVRNGIPILTDEGEQDYWTSFGITMKGVTRLAMYCSRGPYLAENRRALPPFERDMPA